MFTTTSFNTNFEMSEEFKKNLAEACNDHMLHVYYERLGEDELEGVHPHAFEVKVTMDIVNFLSDYIDWTFVALMVMMDKEFIESHIDKLDIIDMTNNCRLPEEWVIENKDNIHLQNAAVEMFKNGAISLYTVKLLSEKDVETCISIKKYWSKEYPYWDMYLKE